MALNITILGLGPVGTSLGLALGTIDAQMLDVGRPVITGWDRDQSVMKEARGRLAADRVEGNLQRAVREADVVIAAVDYGEMRELLASIAPSLKNGAIVTDTTATKAPILEWATELLPITVEFIGGHPLTGFGDDAGLGTSRDALRGAIYCLVPLPRTRRAALDGVEALVTAIEAKPYYMDAFEHDSYVAAAAHLPLALALALMETVGQSGGWREIQAIAGEGLLRMTELASGDAALAGDALLGNAAAIDGWLDRLIGSLIDLQKTLRDPGALEALLERSRVTRDDWLRSEPNLRPGESTFHGNLQDVERPNLSGLFFGRRRPSPNPKKRR